MECEHIFSATIFLFLCRFFYQMFSSFYEHLRKILDVEWWWERFENQWRLTLHGHGAMKLRNDHHVIRESATALIGYLAHKRRELLEEEDADERLSDEDARRKFADRRTRFSDATLNQAKRDAKPIVDAFIHEYDNDFASHSHEKYAIYIGVAYQKAGHPNLDVCSGKLRYILHASRVS